VRRNVSPSDMRHPDEQAQAQQFLSFTVAGDACAVPILRVHEILQYETLTQVPHAPAFIRGVLNRRGSVLPVVDLAVKFGRAASTLSKWSCVVVLDVNVDGETLLLGVLVDAVEEVLEFGPDDIEPTPAFGTSVRLEYLQGMGKRGKHFVLLLDIDRVLSARELELSEALAEAEAAAPAGTPAPEAATEPAAPEAPTA
jgi:purine-binding chemotaxis protein CheW